MPGKSTDKQQIRASISECRQRIAAQAQVGLSAIIMQKIEQCDLFRAAQTVLCYWPIAGEVQLIPLIEKYAATKTILLPVVKGDSLELRLFTGQSKMQRGVFGIPEPKGKPYAGTIDAALIPGVAFDNFGHRLGRGKGFYDRFLLSTSAYKIGVAFRWQLLENIPVEPWDVIMDEVITD